MMFSPWPFVVFPSSFRELSVCVPLLDIKVFTT